MTVNKLMQSISKGQPSTLKLVIAGLQSGYASVRGLIRFVGIKKDAASTTIFLQMPSSKKGLHYDVVLRVESTDIFDSDTEFKVYSNSPSFVFNFVYVFNKGEELLYPQFYPSEFRMIEPKAKNPFALFGFDKSLYNGIQFIKEQGIKNLRDSYNEKIPTVSTYEEKKNEIEEYEKRRKGR